MSVCYQDLVGYHGQPYPDWVLLSEVSVQQSSHQSILDRQWWRPQLTPTFASFEYACINYTWCYKDTSGLRQY